MQVRHKLRRLLYIHEYFERISLFEIGKERSVAVHDPTHERKIGGIRLATSKEGDSLVTWEQQGWGFQSLS